MATLLKVQAPRVNCSLALNSALPSLSNLIIHPREQLDWGEPDDRWSVSRDCADLIEERVQCSCRLIRKQDSSEKGFNNAKLQVPEKKFLTGEQHPGFQMVIRQQKTETLSIEWRSRQS